MRASQLPSRTARAHDVFAFGVAASQIPYWQGADGSAGRNSTRVQTSWTSHPGALMGYEAEHRRVEVAARSKQGHHPGCLMTPDSLSLLALVVLVRLCLARDAALHGALGD